uniref:Uncharacterized protein n=1 Tax=Oryza nivara TaxID=4536 RepID=A0A0E0FNP3_ORYNI
MANTSKMIYGTIRWFTTWKATPSHTSAVPYALSQGGWLSLVLFTMVGANCFYTGNLIDHCMRANR